MDTLTFEQDFTQPRWRRRGQSMDRLGLGGLVAGAAAGSPAANAPPPRDATGGGGGVGGGEGGGGSVAAGGDEATQSESFHGLAVDGQAASAARCGGWSAAATADATGRCRRRRRGRRLSS